MIKKMKEMMTMIMVKNCTIYESKYTQVVDIVTNRVEYRELIRVEIQFFYFSR